MTQLIMPYADDFHVHLRQGALMRTAVGALRQGGVGRCLVMPNTRPPVATTEQALAYRDELRRLDERVEFLMTLYLTADLTPAELSRAARAGLAGVKYYPPGVTTHSEHGVADLAARADLLAAMEAEGLVLELHGEVPSRPADNVCVLNAEQAFLPLLEQLHARHPRLRIVLEHVTTAAGVAAVERLGATVAATVTAHHLELTADDWAGHNHNFCKPVAKYPEDREALRRVVRAGHPRFFLGSDSAPHPREAKECAAACAGVFTAPWLLPYLADTFDRLGCLPRLPAFASEFGRRFYGLPPARETLALVRRPLTVPALCGPVVPYRARATLAWALDAAP